MPPLVQSAEFRHLRNQLRTLYAGKLAGNDYDVFVISRFDGDDDTLRPYLSTAYRKDPLLPPQTLYPAQLMSRGKKNGPEWVTARDQGGGHAEETFIRSLNELGGMFGVPRLIEVFVSRIPCADRSSVWNAHKPFVHENMTWPAGCGPKLCVAMEATPHIQWELYWDEPAPNEGAHSKSLAQMTEMALLPNAEVSKWP